MAISKRRLRRLDARIAHFFARGTPGTMVAYVVAFALIGRAILLAIRFTQSRRENPDLPAQARESVFAATMLFERISWLAGRSTLLLAGALRP